jgi:hypothetical protein
MLESLELLGFSGEPTSELATGTFFLGSIPKLKQFTYHGVRHAGIPHLKTSIFGTASSMPPLVQFDLEDVTMTDVVLIAVLEDFLKSLERLSLSNIRLSTGSWRDIFDMVIDRLPLLRIVVFSILTQADHRISFLEVDQERPYVCDTDFYEFQHQWFEHMAKEGITMMDTSMYEEMPISSVMEEMDNGYAWVFHEGTVNSMRVLRLDTAEDGELKPWLELARDKHTLLPGIWL